MESEPNLCHTDVLEEEQKSQSLRNKFVMEEESQPRKIKVVQESRVGNGVSYKVSRKGTEEFAVFP